MPRLPLLVLAAATLSACAQPEPPTGASVRATFAAQRIATQPAGADAAGMDGRAARAALDRYERSFSTTHIDTPLVSGSGK